MEGNKKNAVVFSILFSHFLFNSVSFSASELVHYQTFIPTSLPKPVQKPLSSSSWPTQQDSETQIRTHNNILSFDLHHLGSLPSLSQLSSQSLFDLRLRIDSERVKALSGRSHASFSSPVVSGFPMGIGEYFTRIGAGTPQNKMYMILDTGSDLIWFQCSGCKNSTKHHKCYNQSDPIFNPSKSKSFSSVPCNDSRCLQLEENDCNKQRTTCLYGYRYGDDSFTVGELSTETLTFGETRLANITFGCGYDNEGSFDVAAGLLGLGRGGLSFPSQIGSQFSRQFSYCLVGWNSNNSSPILFGESAVSPKSVFTPLISNPTRELNTFYYVGLNGISVGGNRVNMPTPVSKIQANGRGGVIVDSGTIITRFPGPVYEAFRDAFLVESEKYKLVPMPMQSLKDSLFDTCFKFSGKANVTVPTVTLNFNEADVQLGPNNVLIPVDENGTYCFAFAGINNTMSILGGILQQGFRVSFDLKAERVGFTPDDCA